MTDVGKCHGNDCSKPTALKKRSKTKYLMYCSDACKKKSLKLMSKLRHKRRYIPSSCSYDNPLVCDHCGKDFKGHRSKHCSRKCKDAAYLLRKNPNHVFATSYETCIRCDKPIEGKRPGTKFCTKTCATKHHTEKQKGKPSKPISQETIARNAAKTHRECNICKTIKCRDDFSIEKRSQKMKSQCKECVAARVNTSRANNREEYNEYMRKLKKTPDQKKKSREYMQSRRDTDPAFKLRNNVSIAVGVALRRQESSKLGDSTLKYLPYTIDELKRHLEGQFTAEMTWDNYGSYWHLDHIIPQALLSYDSMEHTNFQKCWALSNLQPLPARENRSKGSLYEGVRHRYDE
jgi:ribosomal protein L5